MRLLWTGRDVAAPASVVWDLLVTVDRWPDWGLSVRAVEDAPARIGPGATGRVVTAVGAAVPFEVTAYDEGRSWSWRVAGIPATDHRVEARGHDRCRVEIGVPWPAAPYLAVCAWSLRRVEQLATADS